MGGPHPAIKSRLDKPTERALVCGASLNKGVTEQKHTPFPGSMASGEARAIYVSRHATRGALCKRVGPAAQGLELQGNDSISDWGTAKDWAAGPPKGGLGGVPGKRLPPPPAAAAEWACSPTQ